MLNFKQFLIILIFLGLVFVLYSSKVFDRFFLAKNLDLAQPELQIPEQQNIPKEIEADSISKDSISEDKKAEVLDASLLKKYSKTDFLDEKYVPSPLIAVNKKYLHSESRNSKVLGEIVPFLENLLVENRKAGLSLQFLSGYRSFDYQAMLKKSYIDSVGLEEANKFSADAGFSEHQLGTAIDFTTPEIGGKLDGFEKTKEYSWLLENAYKFGFVLSYPENNLYYKFEPWHWRFVGIDLATRLKEENKYLENLEQKEINKYLDKIFENN